MTRIYVDLPGTGATPAVEPTSHAVLDAVAATVDEAVGRGGFWVVAYGASNGLAEGAPTSAPSK